jgi:hypothetical protein
MVKLVAFACEVKASVIAEISTADVIAKVGGYRFHLYFSSSNINSSCTAKHVQPLETRLTSPLSHVRVW